LVFARSRRPTFFLAAVSMAVAAGLLALSVWALVLGSGWAAVVATMIAGVALAVTTRMIRRLRHWPPSRLGLFADRLVVIQGQVEMQAPWELVETATLVSAAEEGAPAAGLTPLRLTDRLTVRLAQGRSISLRPAVFGVEPAACRDLVLRLRDDVYLRGRLPEFDSMLDLVSRPPRIGALIRPQL
jgi:membrane protein implicated in regulation of membrane protease activity